MKSKEYRLFNILLIFFISIAFLFLLYQYGDGDHLTCTVLKNTGFQCSSCGLTRDFFAFIHLDFANAINPNSKMLFGWLFVQMMFRLSISLFNFPRFTSKLVLLDMLISGGSAIVVFIPFWY